MVVQVKALACELPSLTGVPLSRFSTEEIAHEVVRRGIAASISGATVWRWLNEDAIRPWYSRSWIFPRDPDFEAKAGRVLDLYHGQWNGKALQKREYVLCADEKTSIQARIRKHPSTYPAPGQTMRVEHEYERGGSMAYIAAMDVHRAKLFGRCESHSGIEPFDRLLADVMATPPYRSARRVFLVVDNGSSHRGQACVDRIQEKWPKITLVHLPIHASWLNQIEIFFSIVQRKVLTPNDTESLEALQARILQFQDRYEELAKPFQWKFTRSNLTELLHKFPDLQMKKSA